MIPDLDTLLSLETELHQNETRKDRKRLDELLHPDFFEIGRSGSRYSRDEILEEFSTEKSLPQIEVSDVYLHELGSGIALLTYKSNHLTDHAHRYTLRSSLWVYYQDRWTIKFHQGTPTSAPQ